MSYLSWVLSFMSLVLTFGIVGACTVHRLDEAWAQAVFLACVVAVVTALEWENRKNTWPS